MNRIMLFVVLLLTVAPFTNCGQASTNSSESASSSSCTTANCINQSPSAMTITNNIINTRSGGLLISAPKTVYSVSGDCNEGGFLASNIIVWELHNQSGIVRRSTDALATDGASLTPTQARCVNGRYIVSMYTGPINSDQEELNSIPSSRSDYFLKVILSPISTVTDGSIGVSVPVSLSFAQ